MTKSKPLNILHLFTDRQRFDTIAAHGNPYIRTPNLDCNRVQFLGRGNIMLQCLEPASIDSIGDLPAWLSR